MTYLSTFVLAFGLLGIIIIWSLVEIFFQRRKEKVLESQNS
jgi:hypothetical protein